MSGRKARARRQQAGEVKAAKVGTPLADRAVSRSLDRFGRLQLSTPSTRGVRAIERRAAITGESTPTDKEG